MCNRKPILRRRVHHCARQHGLSLIETVLFIVVLGIGMAGTISFMGTATKHSADPMLQKQALAIAESVLEQVTLMPFCDPAAPRNAAGVCTAPDAIGPEAGEASGSAVPYDNVNDYDGLTLTAGQGDIDNNPTGVTIPAGYSARIIVAPDATLGPAGAGLSAASVNLITVSVTILNTGGVVTLQAYRTLY